MGADDASRTDAKPVHEVTVDGFWMDRTEVTNRQFARFVKATGFVTVAERKPDAKDFPDAPPEKLVPGSLVFSPPAGEVSFDDPLVWWRYVPGANWRHPEGPETTIEGKDDYPVVQVCWDDAAAYTRWAGKRLPTEAEWEYAARGGRARELFVWGDQLKPADKWPANIWQGRFPSRNTAEDGYPRTAPVATFPPNGFGLHRHGRERLGVVCRLVPAEVSTSLRDETRKGPPRASTPTSRASASESSAADRSCAPTNTVRATAREREAKGPPTVRPLMSDSDASGPPHSRTTKTVVRSDRM